MAFPTSAWPGALDAAETRVDLSDVVYADDFIYHDSRIRNLQSMFGNGIGQIVGQLGASNEGPGGLASPVADGGIAVKLAAKDVFTSGDLLQVLDGGITGTIKARINYAGLLWALAGIDASNALLIPYGALPVAGTQGRLQWDTGTPGLAVDNGAAWVPVGSGSSVFEVDSGNNEIQPLTANIGRSFIVGSQSMDDSGTANDSRMFFDKSDGSFRAGMVDGVQWDSASRGDASFACGQDTIASGDQAHAEGRFNVASGNYSHVEGYGNEVSANWGGHAEGWETTVGPYAYSGHAEGHYCTATGGYSHAQNLETESEGAGSFAWGRESISRNAWSEAAAGASFDDRGDGQNIRINAGIETTSATPQNLTADYAGWSEILISDNSIWGFEIRILGRTNPDDGGDSYFSIIEGIVSRSGVNVSIVPGPSPLNPRLEVSSAGGSGWSSYVADSTSGDFEVWVVGDASDTVHWVAEIRATEIIMLPA